MKSIYDAPSKQDAESALKDYLHNESNWKPEWKDL